MKRLLLLLTLLALPALAGRASGDMAPGPSRSNPVYRKADDPEFFSHGLYGYAFEVSLPYRVDDCRGDLGGVHGLPPSHTFGMGSRSMPVPASKTLGVGIGSIPVPARDLFWVGAGIVASPTGKKFGAAPRPMVVPALESFRVEPCAVSVSGWMKPEFDGVASVFAWRRPLQVFLPVVRFYAVDMVDILPVWTWGEESASDDDVHAYKAAAEADLCVPIHDNVAKYPSDKRTATAGYSFDAAKARNAVAVAHAWDRPPLFCCEFCRREAGGILIFSHGEPPIKVPMVRSGLSVSALGRAALHCNRSQA